jgi:outer membrane scaffolding protein for murein synthesis (MipA/OmpV family)
MLVTKRFSLPALTALLAVGATLFAPLAFAQAFDAVRLNGALRGGDGGRVGAALISGRQYQGSDERRTLLLPLLDYQWTNGWFAGTTNGIGYNFSSQPDMDFGARLTVDPGRNESRSSRLRGLGDIGIRPELGGFYNYRLSDSLALTSSLRYGSGNDRNGLVIDIGAAYSVALAPRWRLGLGVTATYANANYMQSYFGVTPAQAVTSGYAPYTAGAGRRDVRAGAALTYIVNPKVAITTALSASSLQGDAQNSPLARQRNTLTGIVGASYAF